MFLEAAGDPAVIIEEEPSASIEVARDTQADERRVAAEIGPGRGEGEIAERSVQTLRRVQELHLIPKSKLRGELDMIPDRDLARGAQTERRLEGIARPWPHRERAEAAAFGKAIDPCMGERLAEIRSECRTAGDEAIPRLAGEEIGLAHRLAGGSPGKTEAAQGAARRELIEPRPHQPVEIPWPVLPADIGRRLIGIKAAAGGIREARLGVVIIKG